MSDEIREIGGNKLALWWGKKLFNIGKKYIDKGSKTTVSNPSCTFPNAFTMILSFTVNNTEKYQLINQGKYKERFREQQETEECPVSKEEMFMMITSSTNRWFKKEI